MRLSFTLFVTLILSFNIQAQDQVFKLAFIDSSLCLSRLEKNLSQKIINFTELKTNGDNCQIHLLEDPRPYHAQFVLEAFLQHLDQNIKIKLYHFNVFTPTGQQDIELWQKAIHDIVDIKPHLALITTGGLLKELWTHFPKTYLQQSWSTPTLVSSGQIGPGIGLTTKLWPHDLIDKSHLAIELIGADSGQMLYQEKISASYSDGMAGDLVRGSSRAAALAAAKRINQEAKKPD